MSRHISDTMKKFFAKTHFYEFAGILCMVAITVWGYHDVLDDFFVMDDIDLISGFSSFQGFLRHLRYGMGGNFYRPLINLLFIWDFYWSGWHPLSYHLTNLFFHTLNVLLVYWLTKHLTSRSFTGTVAGILFGLHPIHTEAVTWISGRFDVVCATFFLLSVCAFVNSRENMSLRHHQRSRVVYMLSLVFFLCALLTKEMAVTLPFVIVAYDVIFPQGGRGIRWKNINIYIPYFALVSGYFAWRFFLFSGVGGYDVKLGGLFLFENVVTYCKFLTLPFADALFSSSFGVNLAGIAILMIFCAFVSATTRFAVAWILITLFPVFMITVSRGAYLASVGFCMVAGIGLTLPVPNLSHIVEKPIIRSGWRLIQLILILVITYQYGMSLAFWNNWWSRVADINESVPRMIKTIHPTFPQDARICIQDIPIVFNQRFNSAFALQFPDIKLGGIYTDFEACAKQLRKLDSMYFFHYNKQEKIITDVTYQQQEEFRKHPPIQTKVVRKQVSREDPDLQILFDGNIRSETVGIVVSLANGIDVHQGQIVAYGHIKGRTGEEKNFEIVAGQDVAEWAIRFPIVREQVRHDAAQIYKAWTVRGAEKHLNVAQNYIKKIELDRSFAPVQLSITFADAAGVPERLVLDIDRVVLYADTTTQPEAPISE